MTREEWLNAAAIPLSVWIKELQYTYPINVRVACGFPSRGGMSKKKRCIGECWDQECSGDKTWEIFVSPTLEKTEDVLSTLLHEMIHATVGITCGHKGEFKTLAKALGFNGPMTQTPPGEELTKRLHALAETLPAYPHARLEGRASSGPPKQGTRMIKLECACGYVVRAAQKWIDQGVPTCSCGGTFEVAT